MILIMHNNIDYVKVSYIIMDPLKIESKIAIK